MPSRQTQRRAVFITMLSLLGVGALFLGFDSASPDGARWLQSLVAWTGLSETSGARQERLDPTAASESQRADAAAQLADLAKLPALPANRQPFDLLSIEGQGGEGIHRAVRRAGVWFPVFSPGRSGADASPDDAEAADLPLYITSPTPPPALPDQAIRYPFEAIGGRPPYRWRMVLGVEGFSIDPATGLLSGQSPEPLTVPLAIHVTDAAGAEDSALYTLRISEASVLTITTTELPIGTVGTDYSAPLSATGGTPPYTWSTDSPLPEGFSLAEDTGTLSGLSTLGIDAEITVRVTDSVNLQSAATLTLKMPSQFEISTPARLAPAAPGAPYELTFQTDGGTAPLRWRLIEGSLPIDPQGIGWILSAEGLLRGTSPLIDSSYRFTLEAEDDTGSASRKTFTLPVRRSLVVMPSRGKAGLAWQPREINATLGLPARAFTVTRSLSPDGAGAQVVYQGSGTNFVDRNLAPGITYYYTLNVHPASGPPIAFAATSTALLPFTTSRGTPGRLADPHADAVKVFRPLTTGGHGSSFAPGNVTGPPDGRGTFSPSSDPSQVLSLHARAGTLGTGLDAHGGAITLAFEDNLIDNGPGEDFTVFENVFFINGDPNQRFMEPAIVSVALFEDQWYRFPIDVVPPATSSSTPPTLDPFYYNRGFAGRNATTGGEPTDPRQSGGDSFDLSALGIPGLTWVRYIKIQSTGHNVLRDDFGGHPVLHTESLGATSGSGSSGFDLDAVTAIHY